MSEVGEGVVDRRDVDSRKDLAHNSSSSLGDFENFPPRLDDLLELHDDDILEFSSEEYVYYLFEMADSGNSGVIYKHLPAVLDKFERTNAELKARGDSGEDVVVLQTSLEGAISNGVDHFLDDPQIELSKDEIQRLYALLVEGQSSSTAYVVGTLIKFDDENEGSDDYLNLGERAVKYYTRLLMHPEDSGDDIDSDNSRANWIGMDFAIQNRQDLIRNALEMCVQEISDKESLRRLVSEFSSNMGLEVMRKELRRIGEISANHKSKVGEIEDYMGIGAGKRRYSELRDLYEDIDFSEYSPNVELNEFESELLREQLSSKKSVLDIACGTGRLVKSLVDQGKRVTGIDIVPGHVEHAKKQVPDAELMVADWNDMPFDDGQFDAAYCLGRSFAHNTTISDAVEFLREATRVVKDEGFVIVDFPDPESPHYMDERQRFSQAANKLGILNYNLGSMHDSPDGEHFFDRLALYPEQIRAVAAKAGLDVELVGSRKYKDVSGLENKNIYCRFTKSKRPYTWYELQKLERQLAKLTLRTKGRVGEIRLLDDYVERDDS